MASAALGNRQRLRQHMLQSVLIRAAGFGISLVLMRIYLGFFESSAVLGVWFTLLAFLNWVVSFDFGVGNGLRNRLVEAIAANDEQAQRALISSTYAISTLISAVLMAVGAAVALTADWNALLNVSASDLGLGFIRAVVLVVMASVCAQLILKNANSLLYAVQMPSLASATGLMTNVLLLIGMVVAHPADDMHRVSVLAWMYLVFTVIPLVGITLWLFNTRLRHVRPRVRCVTRAAVRRVFALGMGFFGLQVLSLGLFASTEVVLVRMIGPASVVQYQLYNRLYNSVASLIVIALVPIWSAVSEAQYVGDEAWILGLYRRVARRMGYVVLAFCCITLFLPVLFRLWLGEHAIEANYGFGAAFVVYYSLYVWWGILATFANGKSEIRQQLAWSAIGVIVYVVAAIALTASTGSWIAAVWANSAGMLGYCLTEPRRVGRTARAAGVDPGWKKSD